MLRRRVEQAGRTKVLLTVAATGAILAGLLVFWPSGESYQDSMYVGYDPTDVPPVYDPALPPIGTPWFDAPVAEALSAELARAVGRADLCIGWDVDEDGFRTYGSNRGVGHPATACARWVVVAVATRYVPESSEASDTAGLRVVASDPELEAALAAAPGLTDGADHEALLGDDGDLATANVVAAVPLALAAAGLLEPIAVVAVDGEDTPAGLEGTAGEELGDDEGEDGNEALHQNAGQLRAGLAVLVLALTAVVALVVTRPATRAPARAPGAPPVSPRAALRARVAGASRPPAPVPGGAVPPPPPPGPPTPAPPPPEHHP